jgi:hypothetical protein
MKIKDQSFSVILVMIFTAVIACSVLAQSEQSGEVKNTQEEWSIDIDPTSKARIKYIEDSWDFGSIPESCVVTHDFGFYNSGEDTLIITSIKPTCGCTTVPLKSNQIAPGDTSEFAVTVNTKNLKGQLRKFINIECSDPVNPYMRIVFKANVNDPGQKIITVPDIADFGKFKKGTTGSMKLEMTNNGTETANLLILDKPTNDNLKIKFDTTTLQPGESTKVHIDFDGNINSGEYFASITLEAEGISKSRFTIPIKGTVIE